MGWTISLPNSLPQPGQEYCITISGGSGGSPTVTVQIDGRTIEPKEIREIGNGTFVLCFPVPADYDSGQINVSGGGSRASAAF